MPTRLARLGVLVVAAAFVGYWALLVYCDLWRPLPPGLILSFDAGRVAIVDVVPGSGAARAGLEPGDLLSASGQSINGRLHWMAIEANFEIGRPAALPIDRHGRVLTAAFTPEPESWLTWRTRHGPELLVIRAIQFVTLLLALFVALKRPNDPIALVGSALLATIGVFSVTLPFQLASRWRALPPPVGWLLWMPFMSSAALAGWGLSFFTIFPRPRFRTPSGLAGDLGSAGARPDRPGGLRLLHGRAAPAAAAAAAVARGADRGQHRLRDRLGDGPGPELPPA